MTSYRAPRGKQLNCADWTIESAYRMVQNNLDRDVAEDPERLIVYGGLGKAARNPEALQKFLASEIGKWTPIIRKADLYAD